MANSLANIHNARRASSGMVNIVGEHATYHIAYDAPLTADIEGVAAPMSHWVKTSPDARTCRSASKLDPPSARDSAKPSGATLRCAPPALALRPHNLEGGQLFDADPGQQFDAV